MELKMNEAAKEIHQVAADHGFYAGWGNVPEKLMLIVTELAEAMEEYRKIPKHIVEYPLPGTSLRDYDASKFIEELADVQIRLLDLAAALRIDLEKAVLEKHEYNKTRPYKHGKER